MTQTRPMTDNCCCCQVATRTYKKQPGSPFCMRHPRQWETLRYINNNLSNQRLEKRSVYRNNLVSDDTSQPTGSHLQSYDAAAVPFRVRVDGKTPPSNISTKKIETLSNCFITELQADLFSRHASLVEVCACVAVDERGEGAMSDDICHRCNGKQQRRRCG